MELIMLGTSAAYPTADRASSGFLVRDDETSVLIDMGSGVARNLMRWMDPSRLDAIVLSHLHQDHFIDIYPLYYYLAFHQKDKLPIDVYAPEGAGEFIKRIFPPGSEGAVDAVYAFKPLRDRGSISIGDLNIEPIAVPHSLPAFGMRITGERTVAYSSDTEYDEVLFEVAGESDVFICEATKQEDYKDVMHLTARQAGMIAKTSGAKKLVLTHIWQDFDPVVSKEQAAREFDGPVVLAEDNMRIELEG